MKYKIKDVLWSKDGKDKKVEIEKVIGGKWYEIREFHGGAIGSYWDVPINCDTEKGETFWTRIVTEKELEIDWELKEDTEYYVEINLEKEND